MRLFNYSQNWAAGSSSHKMSSRGNITSTKWSNFRGKQVKHLAVSDALILWVNVNCAGVTQGHEAILLRSLHGKCLWSAHTNSNMNRRPLDYPLPLLSSFFISGIFQHSLGTIQ